ncbi:acyl-CoA N-acyltransferase [Phaeosphaeria sp. MPI-PUGE-AT-0046c]|nr:acyl-CoA N-acyltransferase [Phaeosphaeria sp. MPI-PUGE-AT-0046c]
MGFVVLPALLKDISAVYDTYFAAFQDHAVTKALFPSATAADMTDSASEFRKAHTAHIQAYWSTDATQYTVKCVDTENGEVVGMALWDIYLTPSEWRRGEISWLSGDERERAEKLVSPLWEAREKLWLDERYLYCHVVAVHPRYQRRGIGQMLMEYGIGVARTAGLPVYIESSRDGTRLYEKTGCRRLKNPLQAEKKTCGSEESENTDLTLFVWIQNGGEDQLPPAVELA